jgi:hypothetical protein
MQVIILKAICMRVSIIKNQASGFSFEEGYGGKCRALYRVR